MSPKKKTGRKQSERKTGAKPETRTTRLRQGASAGDARRKPCKQAGRPTPQASQAGGQADDGAKRPMTNDAEQSEANDAPKGPMTRPQGANDGGVAASAPFPVVGIGSSAGGLDPLKQLFANMPADIGAAYVVISHHHPGHASILPELIAKETQMQVAEIEDGMELEPDHVYVSAGIPLEMEGNRLRERPAGDRNKPTLPVDMFFRSLGENRKGRAVCIVLSGTGADGTLGLKAVKGHGGMAMVQETASAKYAGMPRSAIGTSQADYVLNVEKMPEQLRAYCRNMSMGPHATAAGKAPDEIDSPMREVFRLLRSRTGHDFSEYKPSTLRRRIERRMNMHHLTDVDKYVRLLKDNTGELDMLFKEFLIGVTSFFRDPEAFDSLSEGPLKDLMASREEGSNIRVWVIGCGSGEEAYTIAISLQETAEKLDKVFQFQVFATDLDYDSVGAARIGRYPAGIANDVPANILNKYFDKEDETYRIGKEVRDMVVFAPQNVTSDPPFTQLDLISCRNVLIYMNGNLQKRIFSLLHYALKPDGLLMLGPSETIGVMGELFKTVDKKHKIYRCHGSSRPELPKLPSRGGKGVTHETEPAAHRSRMPLRHTQLAAVARDFLAEHFAPPSVIIDTKGEVIYVHGRTGRYLEPAGGEQPGSIFNMAREGLKNRLAPAVRQAAADEGVAVRHGLRVKTNGEWSNIELSVTKIAKPDALAGYLLVSFAPAPLKKPEEQENRVVEGPSDSQRVTDLEHELAYTRESLQTTVEELETSNEELKSANEELQSTNEELQSTNEELETSKEELQSLNEELNTVNSQLQAKVDELAEANNDIQNLLNSTDVAAVFIDEQMRINRYTEQMKKILNIIGTDIGRPLGDLTTNLGSIDLEERAERVLSNLQEIEEEVQTADGAWYLMRVKPYRTTENVIEGVVITLLSIDRVKRLAEAETTARLEWKFYENIFDTMREPLLVLDEGLNVLTANDRFYMTFRMKPKATENRKIYDVGDGQWDIPDLRRLLEDVLVENNFFEDYEVEADFERIGKRKLVLNARKIEQGAGKQQMILLAMEDVTEEGIEK